MCASGTHCSGCVAEQGNATAPLPADFMHAVSTEVQTHLPACVRREGEKE